MSAGRAALAAAVVPALALAAWAAGAVALWAALAGDARVFAVLGWVLAGAAVAGWLAARVSTQHVAGPARLLTAARILAADDAAPDIDLGGRPPLAAKLGAEFNRLAGQRRDLRAEMTRLVDEASRSVAQQRDQLAALMTELDTSVVVCNREGEILLYNGRVRELFRRLAGQGGGDPIGLGRSIYAVLERGAIAHALETVEGRLARGIEPGAAVAQFVTASEGGELLQVSLAPVRADGASAVTGFVLLLGDVTGDLRAQTARDRQLRGMIESNRASVASMQAALEMLELPDLEAEDRDRFLQVVRAEVSAMNDGLGALSETSVHEANARWPLQDMAAPDLLAALERRLADAGIDAAIQPVPEDLWLRLDSFALVQAVTFLATRITEVTRSGRLWLRVQRAGGRANLDVGWTAADGGAGVAQALSGVPAEDVTLAGRATAFSLREIAERHGGEVWLERGRADAPPFFRILLPLAAEERAGPGGQVAARPEFYDFDLFAARGTSAEDATPLSQLRFTVFDCETTGLDPSGGDEIIQIGAVRIVNGRILRGETIDQLVDPQRPIPPEGIPIHHIEPHMVVGQPTIGEVLPVFHRFAEGSVLVGHNVAFDMRFLALKEAATGLKFDHPVLDTLLLSSILTASDERHSLEAIAERLGITIGGRHTALGDALATAEVFARMVPLLEQQGVRTLGEAREAASRSQFARLAY